MIPQVGNKFNAIIQFEASLHCYQNYVHWKLFIKTYFTITFLSIHILSSGLSVSGFRN